MTADEIFDQALDDIFWEMGETATFTPQGGEPVTCQVIISKGDNLQPSGYEAQVFALGMSLEALLAETVVEPRRNDTFLVGAVTYIVKGPAERINDGRVVKMAVE